MSSKYSAIRTIMGGKEDFNEKSRSEEGGRILSWRESYKLKHPIFDTQKERDEYAAYLLEASTWLTKAVKSITIKECYGGHRLTAHLIID